MPPDGIARLLRQWGRALTSGFLVISVTFYYTMETWWLGWTLPLRHILIYFVGGLLVVLLVVRHIGFRKKHEEQSLSVSGMLTEFVQIVTQGLVVSLLFLFLLGIIEWGDSSLSALRLALFETVPFGFGAALANRFLTEADDSPETETDFPRNVGVFSTGAIFLAATIAPTGEMELISAHTTWAREIALVVVTISVVYLVLYELGFKDQSGRVYDAKRYQVGTAFLVYGLCLVVSWLLLWSFGHFVEATLPLMVPETVVLSFPAGVAAAGAQVVL